MVSVGIRELKARLSAFVRTVRAGSVVVVTDHGEIVAELRPPSGRDAQRRPSPVTQYREAVAAGWLRPPTDPRDRSWLVTGPVALPRGTAGSLLDAERGDT